MFLYFVHCTLLFTCGLNKNDLKLKNIFVQYWRIMDLDTKIVSNFEANGNIQTCF